MRQFTGIPCTFFPSFNDAVVRTPNANAQPGFQMSTGGYLHFKGPEVEARNEPFIPIASTLVSFHEGFKDIK
jgi:hypothetical protein